MPDITHKRGDTFSYYGTVTLNGSPVDITSWTITSQLRDAADVVIQDFTVTTTDAAGGEYLLSATPADTADWAPGNYFMDVDYVDSLGFKQSTATLVVTVKKDITRAT